MIFIHIPHIFMRLFLSLIILITFNQTFAQFYTVRKKRSVITVLTEKNEAELISKKSENSRPLPLTPHKEEVLFVDTFHLPLLSQYIVTSPYGYRKDPFTGKQKFHSGIDLSANGDNVYSMTHGKIKKVGFEKSGYGNYITIESGDFEFTYAHLRTTIGSKGDSIKAGDEIGISGNTGRSTGEHLHLTIKNKGKTVDPDPILNYIREATAPPSIDAELFISETKTL